MAKDIQIKYKNEQQEWEELYPKTKTRNITDDKGESQEEINENLTTQLVQIENKKVGGGVKAEPEDLSAETLGMITGEGGPINIESIPQDDSVTPEKTTFVTRTKNLYNKETSTDNKVLTSGGDLVDSSDRTTSEFIPVTGGETYITNNHALLHRFDKNYNPVYGVDNIDIDVPSKMNNSTRFVRISPRISQKNNTQLEKGNVVTEYEPYGLIIEDLIVKENMGEEAITPEMTNFVTWSKNLYNKDTSVDNKVLTSGGGLADSTERTTSEFISVEGGETYITNSLARLHQFDSEYNALWGLENIAIDIPFKMDANARYIRVSPRIDQKHNFQLEKGSTATDYEPYGLIIEDLVGKDFQDVMTTTDKEWRI